MFISHLFKLFVTSLALLASFCLPVQAKPEAQNRYASIIIDYDTLEVLHARKIDSARYPASLTKMMTLYLTFDALNRGDIHLNEQLPISANAARTPPVKLGLRAGRSISVDDAIRGLAVRSANDAAVVLAERLGGSEREFAELMTLKAKALGMKSSIFQNAHGLPNPGQTSTARDMAKLAEALLRNHGNYYPYFSDAKFTYGGRTYNNHNTLLRTVEGVDGFKTGFTNASGYNLVLSAERNKRRIIAVVMGGASGKSRDTHMADLIERGFSVLDQNRERSAVTQIAKLDQDLFAPTSTRKVEAVPNRIQAFSLRAAKGHAQNTVRIVSGPDHITIPNTPLTEGWTIQIGIYPTEAAARHAAESAQADTTLDLFNARPKLVPLYGGQDSFYRARLTGLLHKQAVETCKTLASRGQFCLVIAPT